MKIEKFYVHLEPCPLCGGEARLWRLIEKDGTISDWYIQCSECGLYLEMGEEDKYINQTVQKWNIRKERK